jgi:hypothetical protein
MITLKVIAEQVKRMLEGGDPSDDSQLDIREVGLAVQQVRNEIISAKIENAINKGRLTLDGAYLTVFNNIPIQYDSNRDVFYSDIPFQYASLPHDMGVYRVALMQDRFNDFVRIPSGGAFMFNSMETFRETNHKLYELKGSRIEYLDVTLKNKEVLIEGVALVEDFEEDNDIGIPADIQAMVVARSVELLSTQKQIPQDKVNDNVK